MKGPDDKQRSSKLRHRPFAGLEGIAPEPGTPGAPAEPEAPAGAEPGAGAPGAEAAIPEDDLYARAMAGVTPLERPALAAARAARARPALAQLDEEELVMRRLDDLVHGEVPFDFSDTDEHIEAFVTGLDRRLVRKLRRGEFALQGHLDLHGMNKTEAREEVAAFVRRASREGKRCVLIVHGRGHGSREGIPVLKHKLAAWLTRGAIGRRVLAYCSARPYDGGVGAVYVLLRG